MSSNVNPTVPPDNVKVDKATIRANFAAAKSEIEAQQRRTGFAWQHGSGTLSFNTL